VADGCAARQLDLEVREVRAYQDRGVLVRLAAAG
jgi:hypothetical protein